MKIECETHGKTEINPDHIVAKIYLGDGRTKIVTSNGYVFCGKVAK